VRCRKIWSELQVFSVQSAGTRAVLRPEQREREMGACGNTFCTAKVTVAQIVGAGVSRRQQIRVLFELLHGNPSRRAARSLCSSTCHTYTFAVAHCFLPNSHGSPLKRSLPPSPFSLQTNNHSRTFARTHTHTAAAGKHNHPCSIKVSATRTTAPIITE